MGDYEIEGLQALNFKDFEPKFKNIPQFVNTISVTNANFSILLTTGRYRLLSITKIDAGVGKINFSQDVDGDASKEIDGEFTGLTITSDGVRWYSVGGGAGAGGISGIIVKESTLDSGSLSTGAFDGGSLDFTGLNAGRKYRITVTAAIDTTQNSTARLSWFDGGYNSGNKIVGVSVLNREATTFTEFWTLSNTRVFTGITDLYGTWHGDNNPNVGVKGTTEFPNIAIIEDITGIPVPVGVS
jgi:hypothetical protein